MPKNLLYTNICINIAFHAISFICSIYPTIKTHFIPKKYKNKHEMSVSLWDYIVQIYTLKIIRGTYCILQILNNRLPCADSVRVLRNTN